MIIDKAGSLGMAGPTSNHDNSMAKAWQVHWVWLVLQAIMIIDKAGSLDMAGPTSNHDNR